jgi:hypothetical protein
MRTNKQLHKEVTKYFYENRVLFLLVARDSKGSQLLSDEYLSRYYETLAVMNPQTRCLFTKLEVMVAHFSEQTFAPRQYQHVPSVADPMQQVIALLPNLATVVLSLGPTPLRPLRAQVRVAMQRNETLEWLLAYIPAHVEILWDKKTVPVSEDKWPESKLWDIISDRGSPMHGVSISVQIAAKRGEAKKLEAW